MTSNNRSRFGITPQYNSNSTGNRAGSFCSSSVTKARPYGSLRSHTRHQSSRPMVSFELYATPPNLPQNDEGTDQITTERSKDGYTRSKSWKKSTAITKDQETLSSSYVNTNKKSMLQNQPLLKQLFTSAPAEDFSIVNYSLIHKQHDNLLVWNIRTGECSHIFTGHTSDITSFVVINPDTDSPRILSASQKETLFWDLNTAKVVKNFKSVPNAIVVDPHRENRVAMSFKESGVIEIWDFGRHRVTPSVVTLVDGDSPVTSISYFRKRQKLAASYTNRTIRIWNLLSNSCELTLKEDHDIVSLFPIRDHVTIITDDGYCHVWPILTVKTSKKVLSQRISSPVTHGVRFIHIVVSSLSDGYCLEENVLRLTGGSHFPDSYKMSSLDTLFRVTEREQIIIGQFNSNTLCFVLSRESDV